jgi:hypothetical protein
MTLWWLLKELTQFHVTCNLKFNHPIVHWLKKQVGGHNFSAALMEVLHEPQVGDPCCMSLHISLFLTHPTPSLLL